MDNVKQESKHRVAEYVYKTSGVNLYDRWATATTYMEMMRLNDLMMMCVFKAQSEEAAPGLVEDLLEISLTLLNKAGEVLLSEDTRDMLVADVEEQMLFCT